MAPPLVSPPPTTMASPLVRAKCDGCCGIACRNTEKNTASRPLQLFDALSPIDFQNDMFKIPVIGPSVLPAEASSGTGVFLPVYPQRIRARKVMRVRGGRGDGWQHRRGRRMKQEDTFSESFVGDDAVEKEECKEIDEIPIELLLPSESKINPICMAISYMNRNNYKIK
ncbi:hypothetical protein L1987_61037 [Smallanthus sonchifolius]|uniref:Uncharacterized protein n=1 Tax=Smallanthus sonchifolius TaxID=185202 RepID=A0ACB9DA28_9ASTR|nr:hypothetical protein L1987_61037 [Smallanthus sonchifolius]